jgi:hypothetical protein
MTSVGAFKRGVDAEKKDNRGHVLLFAPNNLCLKIDAHICDINDITGNLIEISYAMTLYF